MFDVEVVVQLGDDLVGSHAGGVRVEKVFPPVRLLRRDVRQWVEVQESLSDRIDVLSRILLRTPPS